VAGLDPGETGRTRSGGGYVDRKGRQGGWDRRSRFWTLAAKNREGQGGNIRLPWRRDTGAIQGIKEKSTSWYGKGGGGVRWRKEVDTGVGLTPPRGWVVAGEVMRERTLKSRASQGEERGEAGNGGNIWGEKMEKAGCQSQLHLPALRGEGSDGGIGDGALGELVKWGNL